MTTAGKQLNVDELYVLLNNITSFSIFSTRGIHSLRVFSSLVRRSDRDETATSKCEASELEAIFETYE